MRINNGVPFANLAKSFRLEDLSRRRFLFALAALTVIGCLYYGSYYNYYFNWADEGSVALISEKLFRGERPYVDVEPGYGVLWYYPIALLFKVFGVKFLVIRIWFICLGFAAALFSYGLLWRLTRHRVVAFLAALLVLLLPGSGYKTYIPLLVIAGAYVLFLYDARTLNPTTPPWLAMASNGAYLSIAFLIRGDIATVYSALFLLYHGQTSLQAAIRERSPRRLLLLPTRLAGVVLVAALVAVPFVVHAKAAGYLEGLLHQYSHFAEQLIAKVQARHLLASVPGAEAAGTLWPRASLRSFFWPGQTGWAFLTYAPLLPLFLVLLYLCLDLFKRRVSARDAADFLSENACLIVLSIGVFSTFPQFFVFRPDMAHLSEFMPGLVVLCGYLLFLFRSQVRLGATQAFPIAWRWAYYTFGMLCVVYLGVYATHYPEGIDLREHRHNRLQIEDRIDLYVTDSEYKLLDGLNTMIRKESGPGDYVLCFPYCPGINFVAGRPTFQKFLYVDDSFLISRPNWLEEMRAAIAAKTPKVIVIWNWDINRTRISRFSVWAEPLYRFIGDTYELRARFAQNDKSQSWYEVYVLKQ